MTDKKKIRDIVALRLFEVTNSVEVTKTDEGMMVKIIAKYRGPEVSRIVLIDRNRHSDDTVKVYVKEACNQIHEELKRQK